ncbi:helix-turn-helix domain-containing protein [Nocardia yamanashiensis]|uniref:helix-turn-helix domain-containing protein n=1 Tax=Nocardia yamanashiensis TaxID=209247 RepID=UPI001E51A834|nr:helix-turn-helix domain-containing protein [Nocardia yamanashiensis]UGT40113.1 helix-turn-helix domain-containing protein [Nocardia yamanashiensis]
MQADASSEVIRGWIADFVAETLRTETLENVVTRLDTAIIARVPELRDRDMRRDLAASTRAHALEVLSGLTQDRSDYPVPEQAHDFARTIARRGHDVRLLLRVYHLGQEAVLDYMTDVLDERQLPRDLEKAVLLRLFDRTTRWVSASIETLTDTYMREREQGLRAALSQRTDTVRALLDGTELDIEIASARLGYRLAQRHLALLLWIDEVPSAVRPESADVVTGLLERVVARCATALGNGSALTLPAGASALWAWIGLDDDTVPGAPETHLGTMAAPTRAIEALLPAQLPRAEDPPGRGSPARGLENRPGHSRTPGAIAARSARTEPRRLAAAWPVEAPVRVAVGNPGGHIAGFREGHREAVAARQVAERARPGLPRVLHYAEVELAYLAGVDEAAMRALIVRELGPLAAPDAQSARLRETLHAYLRAWRSPEAAAKALGVHKNTVRYRIQRIEELLGHPIDQHGTRLDLALDCVAVYGV